MDNKPLVSICIITYNSSKTVVETLESAKSQTYQNLELVVSDDCSTDNTIELVENWIRDNKERFVRTVVVKSDHNTGVSANCNRGDGACHGEWIKGLAGDDIFLPNCIEDDVNHVLAHPGIAVLFTSAIVFYDSGEQEHEFVKDAYTMNFFNKSAREQYEMLLNDKIPRYVAPSFFRRGDLISKYPFDETFKYIEDLPQWLRLTSEGYKLYFFDKPTVKWRVSRNNLSKANKNKYYNPQIFDSMIPFFYLKMKPLLLEKGNQRKIEQTEKSYLVYFFVIYILHNKRNSFINKVLLYLFKKFLHL